MPYRGMDRAELDAAYNNTAAVPERDAIVAGWAARSAKVRRESQLTRLIPVDRLRQFQS